MHRNTNTVVRKESSQLRDVACDEILYTQKWQIIITNPLDGLDGIQNIFV